MFGDLFIDRGTVANYRAVHERLPLASGRCGSQPILAWLGHASLDTTNIYAEIDLEMKAKAMALCDAAEPGPDRPWKENKGLMAFLGAL